MIGHIPWVVEPEFTAAECRGEGGCLPWWAPLALKVADGECTPMPVMFRWYWHRLHAKDVHVPTLDGGLLH
jgi:hypothetical protein